jgi:hypothetical protein
MLWLSPSVGLLVNNSVQESACPSKCVSYLACEAINKLIVRYKQ